MIWKGAIIEDKIKIERIFSVLEADYPHKYIFSGESHNFWECVYIADGLARISADDRIYNLSSGEIIFHKPLELHSFFIESDTGAVLYIFSFAASGELTEKTANLVCGTNQRQKSIIDGLYSYLKEKNSGQTNNNQSPKNSNFLYLLEDQIIAQTVSCYITQLILSLCENSLKTLPTTKYGAEIFRKAVEGLNDNVDSFLSVSQLASYLNISESTLKRIFRKYANISVHKYFLTLKIQKAVKLLEDGFSAAEVSDKLGFSSQAYFSACFKRETGKNPSEV